MCKTGCGCSVPKQKVSVSSCGGCTVNKSPIKNAVESGLKWLGNTAKNRNTGVAVRTDIVSGKTLSQGVFDKLPTNLQRQYDRKAASRDNKTIWSGVNPFGKGCF